MPPLTLIIVVLGSIISGIATVNQAGAIGAAGAIVMAGYGLRILLKRHFTGFLLIVSLILIAYSLINYEMNVKAVDTTEDKIGIVIGATGSFLLIVSLIWSGVRLFDAENTMKGYARNSQNNFISFYYFAWCRNVNSSI